MNIAVLPIVVPSDHPQSVATAIAKLLAWGVKPTDAVAIDLERFSLPPLAWVVELCQRWPAAGIYCQQSYRAQYQAAKPRFWWLAAWGADSGIPAGWQARQYGSWRSPSLASTLYDASSVSPALRFWGEAGSSGTKEADTMNIELAAGKEVWIPADGTTEWNAVAQGATPEQKAQAIAAAASGATQADIDAVLAELASVKLTVIGYNPDGSPTLPGAIPRVLQGNHPDVRGPETINGKGFGIIIPGGLAYFRNDGPGSVFILIRYA
jgi:hypothetical protein